MGRPMTKLEEDLARKLFDWQDKCQDLKERIKELKEENKQLKGTRKCSCGKSIFYYTYCKRCRELWEK